VRDRLEEDLRQADRVLAQMLELPAASRFSNRHPASLQCGKPMAEI
jgi:hypothetical protein